MRGIFSLDKNGQDFLPSLAWSVARITRTDGEKEEDAARDVEQGRSLVSSTRISCLLALLALSAPVALGACGDTRRREAGHLALAVQRYRTADNPKKPGLADELSAVPCSDPDVCSAKATCVKTASATAKALRKKSEVEQVFVQLDGGRLSREDPRLEVLMKTLDEAEALLEEGQDGLFACDEGMRALSRKAGLR